MTKKQIKELVMASYKNDVLDASVVEKVADVLSRNQLKQYIAALKKYEEDKSVIVSLASLPDKEQEKKLHELFPGKRLVFDVDPSLLAGMRVVNKDTISEYNLKHTLESIIDHVTENYD